jgi:hypothetical protein
MSVVNGQYLNGRRKYPTNLTQMFEADQDKVIVAPIQIFTNFAKLCSLKGINSTEDASLSVNLIALDKEFNVG